jgi:hypothetical protein
MTVIVSRVKGGKITFTASSGASANTASDFSCQFTSAKITPGDTGSDTADGSYVLCGDLIPTTAADGGFGDKLDFTVVSDHNVATGLIAFSWAHRGEVVAFSYTPNLNPDEAGATAQTFSGTVVMQPLEVGGDVQGDLRISGSLKITGLTPPTAYGTGYAPGKQYASPGTKYAAEPTVTASDQSNADKLAGLTYRAVPQTAWLTGQKITVGTYDFHWTGTKWAPGAAT